MALSQKLDVRQTQSLVMTPQLQQAIKLLQLSNQDLTSFVETEIETNPLLERGEAKTEKEETSLDIGRNEGSDDSPERQNEPESPTYDTSERIAESPYDPAMAPRPLSETLADRPSLRDHLLSQIHMDFTDAAEILIATSLLELLDEAGYLPFELDLVRSQLGADPEFFESVIDKLQRLEPSGIFARNLQECLCIQLRDKNRLDPAMRCLLEHLDLLAKREHDKLRGLCGVDKEDLLDMIEEIRALAPKPASTFAVDVAPTITPDVLLTPLPGGGWHVELNSENLPRVLVNEDFYTQIQTNARKADEKAYLTERYQQATWLVKALRQRANTILKVSSEIVKKQEKFFIYGVQHLKPLTLKDIAEEVEMHESTISRVTQNKYIATPRGLFELKYFFSGALAKAGREEGVSTLAVQDRIKQLIDSETEKRILSDEQIAALLRGEGVDIARRTVAKYREAMKIPGSAQRRRDKKQGGAAIFS